MLRRVAEPAFAVHIETKTLHGFCVFDQQRTDSPSSNVGTLLKAIDQLNRVLREIRNFIARLDLDLFEGKDLPTALQLALKSLTENQATRVRLKVEDRAQMPYRLNNLRTCSTSFKKR